MTIFEKVQHCLCKTYKCKITKQIKFYRILLSNETLYERYTLKVFSSELYFLRKIENEKGILVSLAAVCTLYKVRFNGSYYIERIINTVSNYSIHTIFYLQFCIWCLNSYLKWTLCSFKCAITVWWIYLKNLAFW